MTVPPGFRRSGDIPKVLVLHKARLRDEEVTTERGYSVTRPMRAILDLAASADVDREMLRQALTEGLSRGLITRAEKKLGMADSATANWMKSILEESR